MSTTGTLIFDIETVGEDFDSLDAVTQENLTRWIERESAGEEEYASALADLKQGLGFSPLTGQIVVIGLWDLEKAKGVVYYQAPGQDSAERTEGEVVYKALTEAEMLRKFWDGIGCYSTFVTFNGRAFDVPFLMVRSAVHNIRPTKDLMRGRYLYQHTPDAVHVDLLDQLSFYGAVRRKGSLHLWSRAFGIESPKTSGVTGDEVGTLFKDGKYLDIARYNTGDLRATAALYQRWKEFMAF